MIVYDKFSKVLSFVILSRSCHSTIANRLLEGAKEIGDPKLISMVKDLHENAKKLEAYVAERLELARKKP